jgi:hypothetical protein
LFWWFPVIAALAFCVLAGAFFFYWLHFGNNTPSSNPNDWGPFGDFIAGVTNPIISLFALLSVLLTLLVQSKQLDTARDQLAEMQLSSERQMAHIEKETNKADIYRTIQVLESRLERLYREPVFLLSEGKLEKWEVFLLLSHATEGALAKVPPLSDLGPLEHRDQYLRTKATLTQLHTTLVKLSMQLTLLVDIDPNDHLALFYEPTLSHLAGKLRAIGYLPLHDDQAIKFAQEARNAIRRGNRSTD